MYYCYYQGKSIVVPLHACNRYCYISMCTYVLTSTYLCNSSIMHTYLVITRYKITY